MSIYLLTSVRSSLESSSDVLDRRDPISQNYYLEVSSPGIERKIRRAEHFEASKGVLAICPATMTYSEEILNVIMDAAAAHKNGKGADLVGINMEGPFISKAKKGARGRGGISFRATWSCFTGSSARRTDL